MENRLNQFEKVYVKQYKVNGSRIEKSQAGKKTMFTIKQTQLENLEPGVMGRYSIDPYSSMIQFGTNDYTRNKSEVWRKHKGGRIQAKGETGKRKHMMQTHLRLNSNYQAA